MNYSIHKLARACVRACVRVCMHVNTATIYHTSLNIPIISNIRINLKWYCSEVTIIPTYFMLYKSQAAVRTHFRVT